MKIKGNRFYNIPDAKVPYPSVTTVLNIIDKGGLARWMSRLSAQHVLDSLKNDPALFAQVQKSAAKSRTLVNEAIKAPGGVAGAAANVGTKAHNVIDDMLLQDSTERAKLRQTVADDDVVVSVLNGFERFEQESGVTLTHCDTMVWSHKYRFAGALDAIGRWSDGSVVALDWKTSNALRENYALQVAAYALAWNEMNGDELPIERAMVVRFDKRHSSYEAVEVPDLAQAQEVFLSALKLWDAFNGSSVKLFRSVQQ